MVQLVKTASTWQDPQRNRLHLRLEGRPTAAARVLDFVLANAAAGCEASLTFVGVSASSEHLDPAVAVAVVAQSPARPR